jgi:putative ABC transport system substrate-binding protein
VPAATRVAVLVSAAHAEVTEQLRDAEAAARAMNMQIQVFTANTSHEIDVCGLCNACAGAAGRPLCRPRPFFTGQRVQLAKLAAQYAVPAIYSQRLSAEAGGLISYGASVADAWHQAGTYVGGVLRGARPADLPVVQPSKFELVINLNAAKALGLTVPPTLLARADKVIE